MPTYTIEFKPQAWKDLDRLPGNRAQKIVAKIRRMQNGVVGDVKRLTNFSPEYRLRVGNYRVLFAIEGTRLIIYRVMDRKEAYG